ncbi:hypothetical protein RQP46_001482 [Phenoliferia psychrophenolica]
MSAPKVTLYWLSNSRAQRILWLLEELEVPYALEKFYRDPTTGLSPAPLKALHPLGSSPLIKVEEADGTSHWISESGAIVQFLCECFAGGKFGVKPSDGLRKYNEYNSWLHWAEGTAIVPAISAILGAYEPRFCAEENQAVVKAAGQAFKAGLLMPRMFSYFKYLDSTMVGKEYLVGDSFTGADVLNVLKATTFGDRSKTRKRAGPHRGVDPLAANRGRAFLLHLTMPTDEETPLLPDEGQAAPESFSDRVSTALSKPSALNGLEKGLAALVVFFLLLTATGFGLFAGESVKLGHEREHNAGKRPTSTVTATATIPGPTSTSIPTPSPPGKNADVCLTSTCVTVASSVISALDTTFDPCEDFYHFANGGWLRNNPIPEGRGLFGSAQDIERRNTRTILEILDTPVSKDLPQADQNNIHHLQSFYASCIDEDLVDRQGLAPLLDVVKEIVGAWRGDAKVAAGPDGVFVQQAEAGSLLTKKGKKHSGPWDPKTKKDRLTNTLMYLHSREIPAIFEAYNEGDVAVDPKLTVLWIKQSGLGLPSADYYKDAETIEIYTEIVRASLVSIYEGLGEEEQTDAPALAASVISLEKQLAKISLGVEELDDPKATYNRNNRTELQALLPAISFADYFASYTPRPAYPNPVIVTSPSYLQNATKILDSVDPEVLEAYFVFRAAQTLGLLLGPKQTVRKEIEWLNNFLGGIAEGVRAPRGDVCLALLLENYGFLIGKYYVEKSFAGDSKDIAEGIIVATIQAFRDRLPELDWLDDKTRDAADEKAVAISHKIGYPASPNTEDASAIERYYSLNLPINKEDFFGNVLRSRVAGQRRMWVKIGRQVDPGEWDMIPSEVNAYYSPPANEIAFPAGILQAPYFSKDWPEYMAFGAFGSVAGHELSHAFDQMGRQYNKDGKLEDWWTKGTTERFEGLKGCLLEQYGNYSVLDTKGKPVFINSKFTNGEDMADGGGLAQSYRAWSDRFGADPNGQHFKNYLLPGLPFSREQLFFVAYAQGWARNIKPAEAVKRIRTDPHSPTNYRVIGPLSNSVEFSKAFGCKAGQPMSNVNKCSVW